MLRPPAHHSGAGCGLVDEVHVVHVTAWHVQIRLRIPLDDNPNGPPAATGPYAVPIRTAPCQPKTVSFTS